VRRGLHRSEQIVGAFNCRVCSFNHQSVWVKARANRKNLTWGFPVVGQVGDEQGLGVHDDDVVGRDRVHSLQRLDLLGSGVVQAAWDFHVPEVHLQPPNFDRIRVGCVRRPFRQSSHFNKRNCPATMLSIYLRCMRYANHVIYAASDIINDRTRKRKYSEFRRSMCTVNMPVMRIISTRWSRRRSKGLSPRDGARVSMVRPRTDRWPI
jgi:hypothetical protein